MALTLAACAGAAAADFDPVAGVDMDVRYRVEAVEQAGVADSALASTLRARLGVRSKPWHEWLAYVAVEHIQGVGDDRYNSTANGRTNLPVVSDPEDTELDQAWLGWSREGRSLRAGRQQVNLDNQRFIGAVGFRQNQQTFDGVTAQASVLGGTLFYGWLSNANRVFGEHHPDPARADLDLDAHLLNYARAFGPIRAVAYAYLLEFPGLPAQSQADAGLRLTGEPAVGADWHVVFAAEYAKQTDYAEAPATVDANYALLEAGTRRHGTTLKAGYEVLGGDGTWSFATPLATLHAFDGWADRFLTTPVNGLRDRYVHAAQTLGAFDAALVYHDFVADRGGQDYGTEWNAALGRKLGPRSAVRLEYADYRAETFGADTRIWWLSLQTGF